VFTSPTLTGQLYGEPLVSGADIYVATTADVVYALSATTGQVVWRTTVGAPVPSTDLPCGDISPTVGIVGTPVIDPARQELFAVADELVDRAPAHRLVGLSLTNGTLVLNQAADPPGSRPAAILQRTGLALDAGRVVFGFGGNDGDCSTYHGWVESVPESGGTPSTFEVDPAPGDLQGAIWMGGAAPVVDATGNLWVAAGNGSVTSAARPFDDSDSVLELSPTMQLLAYFAPTTWPTDNADDKDLGSSAPAVLPDGLVVQVGKSQTAYLLRAAHPGGVGGQVATLGAVCPGDVMGGDAFTPSTGTPATSTPATSTPATSTPAAATVVYLPCQAGVVALAVQPSPPAMHVLWRTTTGAGGPPIVADGLVWTISQSGVLYALSPQTGRAVEQLPVGDVANHFPTPTVVNGLLLAPAASRVVAFASTTVPASTTPPTSTVPTAVTTTTAGSATSTVPTHRTGGSTHPHTAPKGGPVAVALSVIGLALLAIVVAVVLLRVRRPNGRP
jgi:outer membrane protein assembly factor BamB